MKMNWFTFTVLVRLLPTHRNFAYLAMSEAERLSVLSRVGVSLYLVVVPCVKSSSACAVQKGTRVLISLWDSLMFGRVPK